MTTPPTTRARRGAVSGESGFTLLEVVVAMVLIGIIATAALALTTRGIAGATTLQRNQSAVSVANAAMEEVRAVGSRAGTSGVTALVAGRSAAKVAAQWSASGAAARSITQQASDSAATTASTPVLAFNPDAVVAGQTYGVSTLIGSCYRPATSTASTSCTTTGGTGGVAVSGYVAMVRVMIDVTWTGGRASSCGGTTCVYRLTALVDPHGDLSWRATTMTAQSCAVTVLASSSPATDLKVLDCVSNEPSGTKIVIDSIAVTQGSLLVDGKEANNNRTGSVVSYLPQSNVTGRQTFTWHAVDPTGAITDTRTVTIRIIPVAVDDSVTVRAGTRSNAVNFIANDKPSNYGQTVSMLDYAGPSCGAFSASQPDLQNGVVRYDAPASNGSCTITYRLQGRANGADIPEDVSGTATITIKVLP